MPDIAPNNVSTHNVSIPSAPVSARGTDDNPQSPVQPVDAGAQISTASGSNHLSGISPSQKVRVVTSLEQKQALQHVEGVIVEKITQWSRSGNNALFAALKSKNIKIVESVLKCYYENINDPAPENEGFYQMNCKARPLGIAIAWGVSDEILKLLLAYGANPLEDVGSYPSSRDPDLKLKRNAKDFIEDKCKIKCCSPERAEEMINLLFPDFDEGNNK